MPWAIRTFLLLAWALLSQGAHAQAPAMRADMERHVAACITCHGRGGQASNSEYFPRLAGKPADYLFEQLRSFRDGRRQQAEMSYLLTNLTDGYLREMARYFAEMDLPYPAPVPPDLSATELARGKDLVYEGDALRGIRACVLCHGDSLTGLPPGIPGLLGLPRLYIAAQLGGWVTGERRALAPDCMAEVGRRLNAEDIRALAGWLSTLPMAAHGRESGRPSPGASVNCSAMEDRR